MIQHWAVEIADIATSSTLVDSKTIRDPCKDMASIFNSDCDEDHSSMRDARRWNRRFICCHQPSSILFHFHVFSETHDWDCLRQPYPRNPKASLRKRCLLAIATSEGCVVCQPELEKLSMPSVTLVKGSKQLLSATSTNNTLTDTPCLPVMLYLEQQ